MADNQPNMAPDEDIPYGDDSPSGAAYEEVIKRQNQEKVLTLALHQVLRDHEAELKRDQGAAFDEDSPDYVDLQAKRTRLEQAIIEAYEQQRQNGLSQSEAAEAIIRNDVPSPAMLELLQERASDIINNQVPQTDIGQEIYFLRQTTPEVFETLTDDEQQSIHSTIALEKLFREASGQPTLLGEWKEKLSDPSARKQLLNTGLKYGGYGLTAAALVSTFPVGTPAIIAGKLIGRNKDFIVSVASNYTNKAAQTLVRSGILSPETVEAAKDKYKQLDEKTKANTFMRHGRKVLTIGAIMLAASSIGIYSESMGLGESTNPETDAFSPDATPDEAALDSAEMLDAVGGMELADQRVFMDSLHQLASESGIDYQSMSSAEVIDQLSAEQQQTLQELVEPSTETVSEAAIEAAADVSALDSAELMNSVGSMELADQRLFMDSLHQLATESGIDHQGMTSAEVIDHLSAEQQQTLQGLVEPSAGAESATPSADSTEAAPEETAESEAPAAPENIEITVEREDTLSEILAEELRAHGMPVDAGILYGENGEPGLVDLVAEANPSIDNPDLIHVGQTINIPSELLSPDASASPEIQPETGAPDVSEPETTVNAEPTPETANQTPNSADLLHSVGGMDMAQQRMFMDSLHQLAVESGIDHQGMSSAEVIDQLSPEQQQTLQGLVEPSTETVSEAAIQAAADVSALDSAELMQSVGGMELHEQRLFMESLNQLATENGIDYQSMSSAEVISQLSTEQQQILSGLVDQGGSPSVSTPNPTFTPPDIGGAGEAGVTDTATHDSKPDETNTSEPVTAEQANNAEVGVAVSEADSLGMMNTVGNLSLSEQRVFMDSLHQVAHENGIDINDLKSHEIISQLPEEHVASLQALATNSIASSMSASEAVEAITSQSPDNRYALVAQLRDLAEYSNLDFNNTPPEDLIDRLPVESRAELLGSLFSLSAEANTPELNEEALAASAQVGNEALEQKQTAEIASNTLGGWLSQKTQGALNWAKSAFAGAPTDTGSPIETGTAASSMDNGTTEAASSAVALSMMAKKMASREGYEKPSFPDVLDNPPQGRGTPAVSASPAAQESTKALGQTSKAHKRSVTKTPGM